MLARQHVWLLCSKQIEPRHVLIAAATSDTRIGCVLRDGCRGTLAALWNIREDECRSDPSVEQLSLPLGADLRTICDRLTTQSQKQVTAGMLVGEALSASKLQLSDRHRHAISSMDE
jgi:hypothetical protein